MNRALLLAAIALVAIAQDHPSGPRMTPPTIRQVAPLGVSRGTSVEMTVEGFNLAGATHVFFSEPGLKAKVLRVKELPDLPDIRLGSNGGVSTIDVGPLPPRHQITMEVEASADADIGPASFRVQTPLGTTPVGTILVEPYYGESPDNEPNDSLDTAFETYLPSILAGTISKPGDVDLFKVKAAAGQQLTFESAGQMVGSALMPVIEILGGDQAVLARFTENTFAHKFAAEGTFYIRISDYQQKGSAGHFYRIKVGDFPLVTQAFPLGIRKGAMAEVKLQGFNLGSGEAMKIEGAPSSDDPDAVLARGKSPAGNTFNRVRLDLGTDPEMDAAAVKQLTLPVTVNGKITKGPQEFRFRAAKGQEIVFEVKARRFGSKLDSYVEVLDAQRKPVPMALARPVWETIIALRDHDSAGRGIRIQSWNGMKVGDYVMIGSEILRIEALPKTPDDDMIFESFNGQRIGYFGTTPEAHANESPVYKVLIAEPDRQFSPNGLPLMRLNYRNDDGGPGYGKDSYLRFRAPADGEYFVRIGDAQGLAGDEYAYRLTARLPRPDFRLAVNPRNPNVPEGGTIPLTVTATRIDGFEDPIEIELKSLPPGLSAAKAVIGKGQVFGTILLTASAKLDRAVPLTVVGRAGALVHEASPEDRLKLIAVGAKPDLVMTAETREVTVDAGSTVDVTVSIQRQNGFGGRVPVEVRNLPPRVRVLDVGLNGVLLNEGETTRTFTIEALPSAEEVDQWIYVSGAIETRSTQQNSYAAPQAIRLKVRRAAPVSQ